MINKVILVGNVGADPEVRTLESGVKTARVRLATTERIFNRQTQESTEHTEWHSITLWRGLADVVDKYVRKGSQIYVEGSLRTRVKNRLIGNSHPLCRSFFPSRRTKHQNLPSALCQCKNRRLQTLVIKSRKTVI